MGTVGLEYEIVLLVCGVASVDSDVSRQCTVFVSNCRNILLDISILEDGDSRLPRNDRIRIPTDATLFLRTQFSATPLPRTSNEAVRRVADKRCM